LGPVDEDIKEVEMVKLGPYDLDRIYNMDCLEALKEIPDKSIDLVIADPPYYKIKNEDWDKQWNTIEDYIAWTLKWALEVKRALKENGSFYIFGDEKIIAHVQVALDKHFCLQNSMVWYKRNNQSIKGAAGFRSFAPVSERILFYSFDDPSGAEQLSETYAGINPMAQYLRDELVRAQVTNKEIAALFPSKTGGLTGCVSNWVTGKNFPLKEQYQLIREYLNKTGDYEYLRKDYEYLRKDYEYLRKDYEDLREDYEDLRRVFNPTPGVYDVIDIPIISGSENTEHPTTKPLELIELLVKASSNPEFTVLDPFMGSGTTAVACKRLGRRFLGFELSEDYCKLAEKRLKKTFPLPPESLNRKQTTLEV
jgi:site-specific DNA-methyltransferase (adenine-specific)